MWMIELPNRRSLQVLNCLLRCASAINFGFLSLITAVFTSDDCWRLVHVHWALHKVSKEEHDWLLVDDDGQVIKRPIKQAQALPSVMYYELDENYFLTDPQNFIYRYFPICYNN